MARKTKNPPSETDVLLTNYIDQTLGNTGKIGWSSEEVSGMVQEVMKRFLERCLESEMDFHLKNGEIVPREKAEPEAQEAINKRNGTSSKTVLTDNSKVRIDVPRDRLSTFDPISVPKYERHLKGLDDKIISMYARGMSNREISAHMKEIYGVSVSAEFISRVTDDVLEDVRTWRSRPLQDFYPVVFFDALRVKVKSGNTITPKALYLALAVKADGSREVLGMWLSDNEGAAYWTSVFNEIRARGCSDILIAVTDGLKGMTKAIETVYPKTMHQTCIVHLLRNSTAFVSYKDLKQVMKELKGIYGADNAEEAKNRLEDFAESDLGKRYSVIKQMWLSQWDQVVPLFNFPPEVRKLIYTTNSIEALNRSIRKVIKTRTMFPTDDSVYKLVYLAIKNATKDWSKSVFRWRQAMLQFVVMFGDRFKPG